MLVLKRKKFFLRIADAFFCNREDEIPNVDIAFVYQSTVPFGQSVKFCTLYLDLTRSESRLFSECSKNTRYEIRRADAQDGFEIAMIVEPSDAEMHAYYEFYQRFVRSKGLVGLTDYKLKRAEAFRAAGCLTISRAVGRDGQALCYHSYIGDGRRARLYHSASIFREIEDSSLRSLIGRANRYLHWKEILYFKERGFSVFDFGGLTPGSRIHQNIDAFKRSFGGREVTEFNCVRAMTPLGRLALRIWMRDRTGAA